MYKSNQGFWVEMTFAAIATILALAMANAYFNSPQPTTIVSSGTIYPLQPGRYQAINFTLNRDVRINGMFRSTNGIRAYIMTSSQLTIFSSGGAASSYLFATGRVTQGGINTNLAQVKGAVIHLVFHNDSLQSNSTVTIMQSITAT